MMDNYLCNRTPAIMNERQDQEDVTTGDLVIEIGDSDTPKASTPEIPQGDTSTADETLNAQAKKETVLR